MGTFAALFVCFRSHGRRAKMGMKSGFILIFPVFCSRFIVDIFINLEVVLEEGLKDYSVARVRVGDVLTGKVISVNDKELAVNVGYRSDGIVPVAELPEESTKEYMVDDSIEVMIVSTDDGEGNLLLSVTRAYATVVWDEFEELLNSKNAIEVEVKEVVKGGVVAKYKGARVFIPASQVALGYTEDLKVFVGKKLKVRLIEVDKAKHKAVASAKSLLAEIDSANKKAAFEKIKEGDEMIGTVARIESYGAFVNIGELDGLLHISNMSWKRIKHPSVLVKAGDKVKVEVIKKDAEKGKISLRLSDIPENPWESVDVRYQVGSVYTAKVARIQPFGVFINLEEEVDGLCHVSEISRERVENPADVLKPGDEVEVKVLSIDKANKRISLSIKAAQDGGDIAPLAVEVRETPEREEKATKAEKADGEVENVEDLGIKPTTLADLFADKLSKFK